MVQGQSRCSKHMSQMLFRVKDCVADGAAGGTGEGADGVSGLDDEEGDLRLVSEVAWTILV